MIKDKHFGSSVLNVRKTPERRAQENEKIMPRSKIDHKKKIADVLSSRKMRSFGVQNIFPRMTVEWLLQPFLIKSMPAMKH